MKDKSLHVLMVDDSENDVLLIMRNLKKGGYDPVYERVDTAASMKKALKKKQWDVILCDYTMPKLNAPSALAFFREADIDIPVIIVSGTIGEDKAVECMRQGARDYLMKSNLSRLPAAIDRELEEAKIRIRQRQAEEKIRRDEQRFRAYVEHSSDIIAVVNLEGIIIYINPAVERVLGFKPEERIGRTGFELVHPDDGKFVADSFIALVSDANPRMVSGEIHLRHKNGAYHTLEAVGSNLINNNVVEGVVLNYRDLTERRNIEEKLRESEINYRQLFDNAPAAIYRVDFKSGKFLKANDLFCEYFGCSREEITSLNPYDILTEDSRKVFRERLEKMARGEKVPQTVEYEIIDKKGNQWSLHLVNKMIHDTHGHVVASDVVAYDITERKKTEEKLRLSEEKYRTILETMQEGYFELDLSGKFTFCNDSTCRLYGYPGEELMGMDNRQYTDKENAKMLFKMFNEVYKTGKPTKIFDWPVVRKDGTVRYVETSASLQKDSSGRPAGFKGIIRDITERKQAEELLAKSEAKYRDIFENAMEGIYQSTIDGRFITANTALAGMAGYDSPEEFIESVTDAGKQLYVNSEDRFRLMEVIEKKGFIYNFEVKFRKKDGSNFWVVINSRPVRNEQGEFLYIEGFIQDITLRKHVEEQLHQILGSLRKAVGTTIQVMVSAIEMRDPYTAGHQLRVANLAGAIAADMELPQDTIDGVRMAGSIHDIGKISIPSEILSKPTKLTDLEFSLIKEHSQSGYDMLRDVESPWPLAEIVHQHHERMDGSGYPANLKGDEILLEARILAVADVVEAMASHRPYREALGIEAALEEIGKNRGVFYDSAVVDACLGLFRKKNYQFS